MHRETYTERKTCVSWKNNKKKKFYMFYKYISDDG